MTQLGCECLIEASKLNHSLSITTGNIFEKPVMDRKKIKLYHCGSILMIELLFGAFPDIIGNDVKCPESQTSKASSTKKDCIVGEN